MNETKECKGRNKTAERIAREMGVSHATVERAALFVEGLDAAEEVLPGITREILSGKIHPTQKAVMAIAKAPYEMRREMAERLRDRRPATNKKVEVKPISDPVLQDAVDILKDDVAEMKGLISDHIECCPDLIYNVECKSAIAALLSDLKSFVRKIEKLIS